MIVHRRAVTALSIRVSRTGWRSNVERLMTLRTSLVAVCCSSASVRSRFRASSSWNSRTFSMAMTAWSAKVWSRSTCLSENDRLVDARATVIDADRLPSRSIGTARTLR